jgi:hypothetical protein
VAEAASVLGFQLSAPVTVVQRPDGLTLRGREGEMHLAMPAQVSPAGWTEAARDGVSAGQQLGGGWELRVDEPAGALTGAGGGSTALVWELPAAALRWHRPLPALLLPLGQPFRGAPWQRAVGRGLVRLLGVPGVVPLLIRWHRGRTRQRT